MAAAAAALEHPPVAALPPLLTHTGGCHCGGVRFSLRAPALLVAWDCNCSICAMKKNTHCVVPRDDFTLLSGGGLLTEYRFGTRTARHLFCRVCGVQSYYHPRSNPDGVAVTVACLDPGTVAAVEVRAFDGVHWEASVAASGIRACSAPAAAAAAAAVAAGSSALEAAALPPG